MGVPKIIKETARNLRQHQTPVESILWEKLRRKKGILKVYRQKPISVMRESDGFERFIIADFYFPQGKLIVEIDGDVHTKKEVVYELDREKEILLQSLGYSILRFQNKAVLEKTDWVISQIAASFSL